jgi:beta-RFAP synthase
MTGSVHVVAPSRLHFGLYGWGPLLERQYGGVGIMVEQPALQLTLEPAECFTTAGPLAARATEFAERCAHFHALSLPKCLLRIGAAPPEHSGLGVGTQLGLSVAAALQAWWGLPACTAAELALSVGRAQRSAIGTHGFAAGGFIAERGKLAGESVSPLDLRLDVPSAWRFVLVLPEVETGLAGHAESEAFARLPAVDPATNECLIRLAREQLAPAVATADFSSFAAALDRYCYLAGMCFAELQGGPFNGPSLTSWAERMRQAGAAAVGQSSWGPTLFAPFACQDDAEAFADRLRLLARGESPQIHITAACNRGAQIVVR